MQQRKRDVSADDGGRLQQALLLASEAVDAGGEDGLDGGRDTHVGYGLSQATGPRLACQHAAVDERPDALLQEERVALGPLYQQDSQRHDARVRSEQRIKESIGA